LAVVPLIVFRGTLFVVGGCHRIPRKRSWRNRHPVKVCQARLACSLLLHRREIDEMAKFTQEQGRTLGPLRLYWKDGRAKGQGAGGAGPGQGRS